MPAYYNENDPKAAAWLRELIKAGHIASGEVDERSIRDVSPEDLEGFTQCHFFAGIGGWSHALRLAGWSDDSPVWTGSCPCQPFSAAGKRKGTADERHLWPEFFRLIAQHRPATVFGEQVASPDGLKWLDGVFADMERADYACGAADLCAAGIGAPHIRQRLYWVADAGGSECGRRAQPEREHGGALHAADRSDVGGLAHAAGVPGSEQRGEPGIGSWREAGPSDSAEHSRSGGLANSNGDGCDQTRGGQSTAGNDGIIGNGRSRGVEHAESDGRQQRGPESGGRSTPSGCSVGGVGNSTGYDQRRERQHRSSNGRDVAAGGSSAGSDSGLGDTERTRLPGQSFPVLGPSGQGYWDAFDLIPCRDGKARRVEPGTFPLAHGVSGRVGLLRGYGNAIVPQSAASFIEAFLGTARAV